MWVIYIGSFKYIFMDRSDLIQRLIEGDRSKNLRRTPLYNMRKFCAKPKGSNTGSATVTGHIKVYFDFIHRNESTIVLLIVLAVVVAVMKHSNYYP